MEGAFEGGEFDEKIIDEELASDVYGDDWGWRFEVRGQDGIVGNGGPVWRPDIGEDDPIVEGFSWARWGGDEVRDEAGDEGGLCFRHGVEGVFLCESTVRALGWAYR